MLPLLYGTLSGNGATPCKLNVSGYYSEKLSLCEKVRNLSRARHCTRKVRQHHTARLFRRAAVGDDTIRMPAHSEDKLFTHRLITKQASHLLGHLRRAIRDVRADDWNVQRFGAAPNLRR